MPQNRQKLIRKTMIHHCINKAASQAKKLKYSMVNSIWIAKNISKFSKCLTRKIPEK